MKKYIILIFILLIIISCKEQKAKFNLNFKTDKTLAEIDTVANIFSISCMPEYPGCISDLGANLFFNDTLFYFLPDSTKLYGHFNFTELINFHEPNRISIGLSSNNAVCNFKNDKILFTIYFKVKESIGKINTFMYLKNITILDENSNNILYEQGSDKINLVVANETKLKLNWIIKLY